MFFKRIFIFALLGLTLLVASCSHMENSNTPSDSNSIASEPKDNISIILNTNDLHYIVYSDGDSYPKKLYLSDHFEVLSHTFEMVTGSYHYVDSSTTWGYSGGGPNHISLYNQNDELIYEILYQEHYLCIFYGEYDYHLYEKDTDKLSLEYFEKYCSSLD